MAKPALLLTLLTFLSVAAGAPPFGPNPDQRTAHVSVRNRSKAPLLNFTMVHKYSDVYVDHFTWPRVEPGELATERAEVRFHAGFGFTGADWWAVKWSGLDQGSLYVSSPLNYRKVLDKVESWASKGAGSSVGFGLAGTLVGAQVGAKVGAALGAPGGPVGSLVGAVACSLVGGILSAVFADAFISDVDTEGFKMHTLRDEDQDRLTEIVIGYDGQVEFVSPSGSSATGCSAIISRERWNEDGSFFVYTGCEPPPPEVDLSQEQLELAEAAKKLEEAEEAAPGSAEAEKSFDELEESAKRYLKSWKKKTGV